MNRNSKLLFLVGSFALTSFYLGCSNDDSSPTSMDSESEVIEHCPKGDVCEISSSSKEKGENDSSIKESSSSTSENKTESSVNEDKSSSSESQNDGSSSSGDVSTSIMRLGSCAPLKSPVTRGENVQFSFTINSEAASFYGISNLAMATYSWVADGGIFDDSETAFVRANFQKTGLVNVDVTVAMPNGVHEKIPCLPCR